MILLNKCSHLTLVRRTQPLLKFLFSRRIKTDINQQNLKVYQSIKSKQSKPSSQKIINEKPPQSQSQLQKLSLKVHTEKQSKSGIHTAYKCDGCSTWLQSSDNRKFGYIDKKVFSQAIEVNKKLITDFYGEKAMNKDTHALNILHQVEKDTGVEIFERNNNKIKNLDNVGVLMALQDQIDNHEESEQLLRRSKKSRKQILCQRCYSLKYHNRLPQQYDNQQMDPTKIQHQDQNYILNKLFHRHQKQDTHFLYLIDILDIAGSFQFELIQRLIRHQCKFSLVVNKIDIVNSKYLNLSFMRERVRDRLQQYCQRLNIKKETLDQIQIFFLSGTTKDGIRKLKQFMQKSNLKRIQLLGYPNTGKTTLLNSLTHTSQITSKIPGTTLKQTQTSYKQNLLKIYDMPGLFSPRLLYNLIQKPSSKALLTWHKFYSPPLLTHQALFFGGRLEIYGARIIIFGLGGVSSSGNQWFMTNYKEFWQGLPELSQLKMTKHQKLLEFRDGRSQDLEIEGFGFVGFRICEKDKIDCVRKLTFYLPQSVQFSFSKSVLVTENKVFNLRDAQKRQHMLDRIRKPPQQHTEEHI